MKVAQLYCLVAVVLLASGARAQLPGVLRPANATGNATAPAPAPVEAVPVPEPAVSTEPVPALVEDTLAPAPAVVEPVPAPVAVEPVPAPVTTEPAPAPVDEPAPEPSVTTEPEPQAPPARGERNVTITLPPAVEDVLTDGALSVVLSTWASLVIPALLLAIA